jgi:hypothetical protein
MRENELSCYFLNSVGDVLVHFVVYLVLKVIMLMVAKVLIHSMLSRLGKEEQKIDKFS